MNKNYKSEQNGRSMVEMLGVLAVIGVLSITGISGYTTAMNKHKANEILDAASKRAVAVSTQIQRGNTNPTLAEFDDNEVGGATFDDEVTVNGDRFQISFESGKEPSEEVWAQMKSITGTDGVVREFKGDGLGLVYNNDLTTDAVASDYKDSTSCGTYATTGRTWCANVSKCAQGNDCCSVMTYNSQCQTCSGGTVTNLSGNCTTIDNNPGTCNDGECVEYECPDDSFLSSQGYCCTDLGEVWGPPGFEYDYEYYSKCGTCPASIEYNYNTKNFVGYGKSGKNCCYTDNFTFGGPDIDCGCPYGGFLGVDEITCCTDLGEVWGGQGYSNANSLSDYESICGHTLSDETKSNLGWE